MAKSAERRHACPAILALLFHLRWRAGRRRSVGAEHFTRPSLPAVVSSDGPGLLDPGRLAQTAITWADQSYLKYSKSPSAAVHTATFPGE